jgi:hypothetical protein
MSKISINGFPKVHRRLDLAGFAQHMRDQGVDEADAAAVEEALGDSYLNVWLNHNQEFRDQHTELIDALASGDKDAPRLGRELNAALWNCTVEEVDAVYELSPELGRWVTATAWSFVAEYRDVRKKDAAP